MLISRELHQNFAPYVGKYYSYRVKTYDTFNSFAVNFNVKHFVGTLQSRMKNLKDLDVYLLTFLILDQFILFATIKESKPHIWSYQTLEGRSSFLFRNVFWE